MDSFTTLDLAKDFGIEHKNILRRVRNILMSYNGLDDDFIESVYKSSEGNTLPLYKMSHKGVKLLLSYSMFKKKTEQLERYLSLLSVSFEILVGSMSRLEDDYYNILCDFIGSENIEKQVKFLQYRVDFHIKETNIFIEYDEPHHLSVKNKILDETRWLEIAANYYANNSSHPTLIRVRKGGEIKSLAIISSLMSEHFKRKLNERFIYIC